MSMNETLAALYGNNPGVAAAEQAAAEKTASDIHEENFFKVAEAGGLPLQQLSEEQLGGWFQMYDSYTKIAADNGTDLTQYTAEQVAENFADWVKRASEEGAVDPAEEDVKVASEYLNEVAYGVQSTIEQVQSAEEFGKIAAHSYVATLRKLAGRESTGTREMSAEQMTGEKSRLLSTEGPTLPGQGRERVSGLHLDDHDKRQPSVRSDQAMRDLDNRSTFRKAKDKTVGALRGVGESIRNLPGKAKDLPGKAKDLAGKAWDHKHRNKALAGTAAAGALVAGGLAAKHVLDKREERGGHKKKAFDRTAAREAILELVERGVDEKVAAERIIEALNYDINNDASDDVKIAAAQEGAQGALLQRVAELITLADFELA